MDKHLRTDHGLDHFIAQWESGTLLAAEWTHAAHVAVCAYYACSDDLEGVYTRMRKGLCRFNAATGTPNTEDRGYHETLTRFWTTVICAHVQSSPLLRLDAVRDAVARYGGDSGLHKRCYSFDVVKSREARKSWIPPDRWPEGCGSPSVTSPGTSRDPKGTPRSADECSGSS